MNERRHMILAWVLIVTVVAAVAATVWLPLTEQAQRNHTRIASLDDRVAKIQTLAATQAKLKTSLKNMERSIGSENSNQFVVAKSPTLGAADLQRRVQAIIVENNARQISSQPLSATNVSDFHKKKVRLIFLGACQRSTTSSISSNRDNREFLLNSCLLLRALQGDRGARAPDSSQICGKPCRQISGICQCG